MPDAGTYSLMKLAEQCRPDAVTVRRFHRRQYGMKEYSSGGGEIKQEVNNAKGRWCK